MKTRTFAIGLATLLSLSTVATIAPAAYAQQQDGAAPGGRPGGRGGQQRRPNPAVQAFATVNPTEEQKKKFDDLQTKFRSDMMALRDASGQNGDPQEMRRKLTELNRKLTDDVEALLNDEQKKTFRAEVEKLRAAQGNPGILPLLERELALTAEQKTKVEPIAKAAQDQIVKLAQDETLQGRDRREKTLAIWNDAKTKIRPLLNPDQQTKLDDLQMPRGGGRGGNRGAGAGGGRGAGAAGAGNAGI